MLFFGHRMAVWPETAYSEEKKGFFACTSYDSLVLVLSVV